MRGGWGALVAVAASAWLLIALWLVANNAPSAGGVSPDLVVRTRAPVVQPAAGATPDAGAR